jgi:hypothetical protein
MNCIICHEPSTTGEKRCQKCASQSLLTIDLGPDKGPAPTVGATPEGTLFLVPKLKPTPRPPPKYTPPSNSPFSE